MSYDKLRPLIDLLLYHREFVVRPYPKAQENHHPQNALYVKYGEYGFWTTFGEFAMALMQAERENQR